MSNKNNLDDLMKLATENSSEPEYMSPKKKANKFGFLIVGSLTLLILTLVIWGIVSKPPKQEFVDKTETPIVNIDNNSNNNDKVSDGISPDEVWSFERPVETPKWTTKPFNVELFKNEETMKEIYRYAYEIQGFDLSVNWMPSGVKGDWEGASEPFTNNTWEQTVTNENGDEIPNSRYKYALKEDYYKAYSTYIQRLINPSFGNWVFVQNNNNPIANNAFNELKDMFSNDWWNSNIKDNEDYSKLPVLADWNEDNFVGLEFAEYVSGRYGTFYGEIYETEETRVKHEFMGVDERNIDIIKVITPIRYVAFGEKNEIEKFGTIELTLASNESISALNNRIIITDVKLTLK